MKKAVIMSLAGILIRQILQAQGTVYLSNLGQPSAGGQAVGSDSWLAAAFQTGTNASGYLLNSVQLALADASGNPSSFTAMIYANASPAGYSPGGGLGTLNGTPDPSTAGTYIYTPASSLTLLQSSVYFIVLTSGTTVVNGAYEWNYASTRAYNLSGGWFGLGNIYTSVNGSSWSPIAGNPEFAITAEAIPEPGVLGLLGLGGLFFLRYRPRF